MHELYHATPSELIKGLLTFSRSSTQVVQRDVETEDALERLRPPGAVGRAEAWYAFDRLEHATYYGRTESRSTAPFRVYRVVASVAEPHPFALVNMVHKGLAKDLTVDAVANEYWTPTMNWSFMEYLCPGIEVVEEEGLPDGFLDSVSLMHLMNDQGRAQTTWPALFGQ